MRGRGRAARHWRRWPDAERLVQETQRARCRAAPRSPSSNAAKPAPLQFEDPERDHAGDQPGDEQRHAEQEVEADRRAEELGDVGRHRHQLGLDPQAPSAHRGKRVTALLGQRAAGDDAQLRREVLDEHRDEVRREHDPHQLVAELGAALEVGGEVPRVDVRDRGDERRPEHPERRPHPPAGHHLLERRPRVNGRGQPIAGTGTGDPLNGRVSWWRGHRRGCSSSSTRIARASSPPSGWTSPFASAPSHRKRTNNGPPNGWRSITSKRAPGAIPCSAR